MDRFEITGYRLGAAAVLLAMTGAVSSADTISFSFTGGTSTTNAGESSLAFTGSPPVPPLSLLVSATQGGKVTRSSTTGLGVSGGSGGNAFFLNNAETLQFDFSPNTVSFDLITLTMVEQGNNATAGNGDNALILKVTSPTATLFNQSITTSGGPTISLDLTSFAPATSRTGLKFSISGVDGNDDFGVGALSVNYTPVPAAVPLPPAVFGGVAVMGCVGFARLMRRRDVP
jgi:hypothetical protein